MKQLEQMLARRSTAIENYVSYVGSGTPRFYLPLDQQLANANFAQFVVHTKSIEEREALRTRLIELFDRDFTGAARAHRPARERPAGRLPGAVPRVGRGHPPGAARIAERGRAR